MAQSGARRKKDLTHTLGVIKLAEKTSASATANRIAIPLQKCSFSVWISPIIAEPLTKGLYGKMKNLRIIVTGGTIDKIHDARTEALAFAPDGSTHVPNMLHVGRCHFPEIKVLMLKDSLHFDDRDRTAIGAAVTRAEETAIVITHGTGTMGETARYLQRKVQGKTVVLTGAMRPFSLHASDGEFNLGGAIVAAQLLEPGVWGVMNGRVFSAENLDKNVETGRFDI